MLSSCEDDAIAKYYVDKAVALIKDYTNRNTSTVLSQLRTYVIDLATSFYNVKGNEGLKSQSYSGVSETYIDQNSLPDNFKIGLSSYRYLVKEKEL